VVDVVALESVEEVAVVVESAVRATSASAVADVVVAVVAVVAASLAAPVYVAAARPANTTLALRLATVVPIVRCRRRRTARERSAVEVRFAGCMAGILGPRVFRLRDERRHPVDRIGGRP